MSKKILAMFMAVAMAFSLLPVTVFAVNTENGQAPVTKTASGDNLTMTKTVTPNEDGTYTVQLESYATGEVTTTISALPTDIVLVLDVSGSMDENISSYSFNPTSQTEWSYNNIKYADKTYYAKIGDEYYPVSC